MTPIDTLWLQDALNTLNEYRHIWMPSGSVSLLGLLFLWRKVSFVIRLVRTGITIAIFTAIGWFITAQRHTIMEWWLNIQNWFTQLQI